MEETLQGLATPGCLFCREELDSLRRDLFWFLNELYFEPQTIERMQRSHGFCRRHTVALLQAGPPSTIGRVCSWLLPPLLAALDAGAQGSTGLAPLLPSAGCSACEASAAGWTAGRALRDAWPDAEVQQALDGPAELCLAHCLEIAPTLSWEQLRRELDEQQRKEAWHVRYEPKAGESSAWRRALDQISGSFLDDPRLLGL